MNRLFLGTIILLSWAFPAAAGLFQASEFTLENGMRGVVIENHKAPIVKHMVWYRIGAADEPSGKGGLAHLLEHLMFRGTQKVKDGEFNQIINTLGAESNAFTGHDVTAYHQLADISKLEALMALEADRMQNLNLSEQQFDSERKIVFQERKQVVENNPASPFAERLNLLLYGTSPYGRPVGGFDADILGLTLSDAQKFYRHYYAPNNAILVLSGDIDVQTAQQLAQKYYGHLPAVPVERQEQDDTVQNFSETLEMRLPNIQATKLIDKYLLPNFRHLNEAIYDYAVLAEYLGGGETSALYRDLVIDQKVAVGVSADYHFVTRGNSVWHFSMLPAEGVEPAKARELLYAAVEKAMNELTAAKLEQVKRKMTADLVYVNDNPEDAAYWIGYMLSNGFSLDEAENYEAQINNVTLNGVKSAFKQLMQTAKVYGTLLSDENKGEKNGPKTR